MPKLSIIVPVYNVEPYLRRCIDSILVQTYTDFEAILIDDGSPDRCGELIDEYAQKDSRIVPIHQENRGVSAARNAGLRAARGEYIGFIDPDDWIEASMYAAMIAEMESAKADMCICNWNMYYEDGRREEKQRLRQVPNEMTSEEFLCHVFDSPRSVSGSACNKIFRKRIILSEFDEKTEIGEDWLFLARTARTDFKVVKVDDSLYHYYSHATSATQKNAGKLSEGLIVERKIIDLAGTLSKKCRMYAEKDYIDACLRHYKQLQSDRPYPYYQKVRKQFFSYLSSYMLSVLSNTYINWKIKVICIKWLINQYIYIYIYCTNSPEASISHFSTVPQHAVSEV